MDIDSYSTELTAIRAEGNGKLKPNEFQGRVRIARFSYIVPVGGEADDNHIALCRLPNGARIMGGVFKTSDMGASSEAVDIGLRGLDGSGYISADDSTDADDDDKFLAAGAVDDISNLAFAHTVALGYGYELEKDCHLVATVETDAWAAAGTVVGHVEYVLD